MRALDTLPADIIHELYLHLIQAVPATHFLKFVSLNRDLYSVYVSSINVFVPKILHAFVGTVFWEPNLAMALLSSYERTEITPTHFGAVLTAVASSSSEVEGIPIYKTAFRIHQKINRLAMYTPNEFIGGSSLVSQACFRNYFHDPDSGSGSVSNSDSEDGREVRNVFSSSRSNWVWEESGTLAYKRDPSLPVSNYSILTKVWRSRIIEEHYSLAQATPARSHDFNLKKNVTLHEFEIRLLYGHFLRNYPWVDWGDAFAKDVDTWTTLVTTIHPRSRFNRTLDGHCLRDFSSRERYGNVYSEFQMLAFAISAAMDRLMGDNVDPNDLALLNEKIWREGFHCPYSELQYKLSDLLKIQVYKKLSVDALHVFLSKPAALAKQAFTDLLRQMDSAGMRIRYHDSYEYGLGNLESRPNMDASFSGDDITITVEFKNLTAEGLRWNLPNQFPWNSENFGSVRATMNSRSSIWGPPPSDSQFYLYSRLEPLGPFPLSLD